MKLKYIFITAALLNMFCASAQDIYTMESVTSEDLNGTARFIGRRDLLGGGLPRHGAVQRRVRRHHPVQAVYERAGKAVPVLLRQLRAGEDEGPGAGVLRHRV